MGNLDDWLGYSLNQQGRILAGCALIYPLKVIALIGSFDPTFAFDPDCKTFLEALSAETERLKKLNDSEQARLAWLILFGLHLAIPGARWLHDIKAPVLDAAQKSLTRIKRLAITRSEIALLCKEIRR